MKNVTPLECALAVALPLTRERFLADLREPERHDYASYVRSLYPARGADDDYYWSVVYEPFARSMATRCERAARCGVTLVRDATLDDLALLMARYRVVTFVSHWRFRAVHASDLDPPAMFAALGNPQSRTQRAFRRELERRHCELFRTTDGDRAEALVVALNELLRDEHAKYATTARGPLLLREIPPERLTRATLERAFPGAVRAAPTIEVADRMTTIPEFIAAVPPDFDGLLDLTVCNSAIIGHAIKTERMKCLVAVNRYPTEPHIRVARYVVAIEELARKAAPFIDVITRFDDGDKE